MLKENYNFYYVKSKPGLKNKVYNDIYGSKKARMKIERDLR